VINGLSSRDDVEAACTIPIGIIPAGSDNSLVWTVLGIRDPIAAALMIVKVKKKAVSITPVTNHKHCSDNHLLENLKNVPF
jgi:diacylglycerol kinase family enzyme